MAEAGLRVLLLERGGEPPESSRSVDTFGESIRTDCGDTIVATSGHVMITGNCLGGASTFNGGAWVEETPDWIRTTVLETGVASFFDTTAIADAYTWVRTRMATPSSERTGTFMQTFAGDLANAFAARTEFAFAPSGLSGQPAVEAEGIFRTYSLFNSNGERSSADQMLDRDLPNLDIIKGAEVDSITYQGDRLGTPWTVREPATDPPTARCVRLKSGEFHCVKVGGRIYASGGAMHTPVLLMNSGIGPRGNRVDNPQVGQNLSDKFAAKITANLKKGMDFGGGGSFGNIAATQQLSDRVVIYEQSTVDLEDSLWDLGAFERTIFPLPLRGSFLADVVLAIGDTCNQQVLNDSNLFGIRNPLCGGQFALDELNCDQDIFGLSVYTTPPRPVGSVSRTLNGRPRVDIDFFETDADYEALGIMFRTSLDILDSLGVAQEPCLGDMCEATCPDLINESTGIVRMAHSILYPFDSFDFREFPSSRFLDPAIEYVLNTTPDNVEAGKQLQFLVNSGQHYAGTAGMGAVVDETFRVMGVQGLYVADSSVVPKTSRGNVMATVMMMSRLAGVSGVAEMTGV